MKEHSKKLLKEYHDLKVELEEFWAKQAECNKLVIELGPSSKAKVPGLDYYNVKVPLLESQVKAAYGKFIWSMSYWDSLNYDCQVEAIMERNTCDDSNNVARGKATKDRT